MTFNGHKIYNFGVYRIYYNNIFIYHMKSIYKQQSLLYFKMQRPKLPKQLTSHISTTKGICKSLPASNFSIQNSHTPVGRPRIPRRLMGPAIPGGYSVCNPRGMLAASKFCTK